MLSTKNTNYGIKNYFMTSKRIPLTLTAAQLVVEGAKSGLSNDLLQKQFELGRLPGNVLAALKTPDLKVVTSIAIIAKMAEKHKLTPEIIVKLPTMLSSPLAVYDSATEPGSVVVLTMEVVGTEPIIASIIVNARDAYTKGRMHWLTSTYPKRNHKVKFAEWKAAGLLRWEP